MIALNAIACLVLIALEGYFCILALRRNPSVRARGRPNYLIPALVLLALCYLAVPSPDQERFELLRNLMLYLVVFSTFLVKRGFTDEGMALLFATIPYGSIVSITLEPHLANKLRVAVVTGRGPALHLTYSRARLGEVADYVGARFPELKVDGRLLDRRLPGSSGAAGKTGKGASGRQR